MLKKKRRKKRMVVFFAFLFAVILILELWSRGAVRGSFASVEEELITVQVEKGEIEQTLKGSGALASVKEEVVVPGDITISQYLVENGDTVKKGDPIAVVKKNSVLAAMEEIQGKMKELDAALSAIKETSTSSSVTAAVDGTVAAVYAQSGKDVVDTMYEKGALLLISLDGLLAVDMDNPGDCKVGDTMTVKDADGNTYKGQVASVKKDTIVVTVSIKSFSYKEKVTVLREKEKLGTGKLYIYSQQKITGYSGTVSSVKVSKGDVVSAGDVLLTLSNREEGAEYSVLLSQRNVLENQYNDLVEIGNSGYVYAQKDGIVSGVDEEIVVVKTTSLGEEKRESAVSSGMINTGFRKVSTVENKTEETVSRSVNVLWMNVDGTLLTEGLPEQVKVQLLANGEEKEEQSLSKDNNWKYVWSGLPKYDEKETEISYTVKNMGDIEGFRLASQVEDSVTLLIFTKQEENQKDSQSEAEKKEELDKEEKENPNQEGKEEGSAKKEEKKENPSSGEMPEMAEKAETQKSAGQTAGSVQESQITTEEEEEKATYDVAETIICALSPEDTLEIEVSVDELDISKVKTGQECRITLDAFPSQSFQGTVQYINPEGSNSGGNTKYTVSVNLKQEENMLLGMSASVEILLSTQKDILTIPEAALVEQDNKVYVYTEYNKKRDELGGLTEVTTGLADGEQVQILSGLEEGTNVYYRYADHISYTFSKKKNK